MNRRTLQGAIVGTIAAIFTAFPQVGQALTIAPGVETDTPVQLRRWLGAEAGWTEIICLTDPAKGPGCLTFSGVNVGAEAVALTGRTFADPDGIDRVWRARTGNRFFRLAAPGGEPKAAYLTGWGTDDPFAGGTVTFGLQVGQLPSEPVVIFRHGTSVPTQTVSVLLTPLGELIASTPTAPLGITESRIEPGRWHTVTLSYSSALNSPFALSLDGSREVTSALRLGGPLGEVSVGIVSTVASPFVLGLDDYVESSTPDAPITGARVHYLTPNGTAGPAGWTRGYPNTACRNAAENWQMVSEDTGVVATESGMTYRCGLTNTIDSQIGGLKTDRGGVVDRYATEGIPSAHQPSPTPGQGGPYLRDLQAQPAPGERILAARVRIRAYAKAGGVFLNLGIADGTSLHTEPFEVGAGSSSSLSRWGITQTQRPAGGAWTRDALGAAQIQLESGAGLTSTLNVFSIRLDYVWVPN